MAAITSAANGLWSVGSTWTGGVVPTAADTVTITHTITMDGACDCLTGVVNSPGILQASTSVSSELRWKGPGNFQFNAGTSLRVDLSAYPTITFRIRPQYGSAAETITSYLKFMGTAVPSMKGAFRKRVTRVQGAQASGSSGTRNIIVDDATGWQVGDSLFLVSTQTGVLNTNFNSRLTITGITGGPLNAVVSVDLAATPIAYSKLDRAYIANESSNVIIADEPGRSARVNVQPGASSLIPALLQDVAYICSFARAYGGDGYVLALIGMSPNQVFSGGGIINCAFSTSAAFGSPMIQESDTYEPFPRIDNLFTSTAVGSTGSLGFSSNTTTFALGKLIRPAAFGMPLFNSISPRAAEVVDALIGGSLGYATAANEGTVFTRCKFWGIGGDTTNQSQIGVQWNECEFEVEFTGLTGYRFIYSGGTFSEVVFNNCKFAAYTTTMNSNKLNYTAPFKLWFKNKNQDVNQQEAYTLIGTSTPTFLRDTTLSLRNRGDASLMIRAAGTTFTPEYWQSFVAAPSVSYKVKGYCRYDNAAGNANPPRISSNSPNTTITGTGVSGNVWTCPAGVNTWNYFELTISHSNTASIDLNLKFDVRSSSATAVKAYFDGVPDYPWVQVARHYGDVFDANIYRTTNPAIAVNEATASAYTGVTVGWGTSTSSVTLGASRTFQYVYDSTQYQSCQAANMLSIPPWEGIGVAGSLSIFAKGDVDTTGFTLNGGGSLSMGVYTLTASLPWPYTYTGGTFNQVSTVPSFSGGSLTLSTAGTKNFNISGGVITFTTAGAYDLSGSTFSGTIELINTSGGAVTVNVSGAPSFTNTGPNITITAPVIAQGLGFTGLIAGSELKIFATGTQTVINTVGSSGTSHTWSTTYAGDVTVDYTILKNGYVPIRVTGVLVQQTIIAVSVQQVVDVVYAASTAVTSSVNTGTKRFTIGSATTGQNFYSYWVEQWKSSGTLANVAFPFTTNGPNSIRLSDGWEITSGLSYWSRDGLSYWNAGVRTAAWAAILTSGTAAGHQVRYLQQDAGASSNAQNIGPMDQLVAIYGDASHDGPFDYSNFLVLKIQKDGFDQAEVDICGTYGTLEDQLYVAGLAATPNGVASSSTPRTITITDSPVIWNGKTFSLTIDATGVTGLQLMQYLRYNTELAPAFQGKPAFSWHDLMQVNGTKFKTVRGNIYGDTGAPLKGVRVLSGGNAHSDFDVMMADDGTVYNVPVTQSFTVTNLVSGSFVQIYDVTNSIELAQGTSTTSFSWTDTVPAVGSRQIRLRIAYCFGVTAKQFIEVSNAGVVDTTVAGASKSYSASQVDDNVYIVNGVDGSAVTGITINDSIDKVVINIAGGTVSWKSIYAKNVHWLSTSAGIVDDGAFMAAIDPANYTLTGFKIRNSATGIPLTITDGYGRDTVTGTAAGCIDNTGSTGNIYAVPDQVISYATAGGSGLSPAESTKLMSLPDATTVAAATISAATTTPIASNIKKVNDTTIAGAGSAGNPWGPV